MAQPAEQIVLNPYTAMIEALSRIESAIAELRKEQAQPRQSEKFLSAKEVETLLKISPPTRIALAKSGRLIPKKIGRKLLYPESDVKAALTAYSKWSRD
ncbi:MAG: helix-turn-helix domain-containing protein [Bacteroidetes bacterium]|nr:helix-turn-helix domain-containing protein [Bacteroidota bacterium]